MFREDAWSARVVERFRRRLVVTESSVARFAVAGTVERHRGRAPGVAEELMLNLALNKPVYVAGGFGGAARDCGDLLGLSGLRSGSLPAWFQTEANDVKLSHIAQKLRPGPWLSLPVTANEIALFLQRHAIGGRKWPENGLTVDENRRLFLSTETEEVASFVALGLRRRFGA